MNGSMSEVELIAMKTYEVVDKILEKLVGSAQHEGQLIWREDDRCGKIRRLKRELGEARAQAESLRAGLPPKQGGGE